MDITSTMSVTIEAARSALGASSLRQRLIADNIANAGSAEHVRMQVVFEERLSRALEGAQSPSDVAVEPEIVPAGPRGEKIELDKEMVDLSSNTLRYQALSRALSRYMGIAALIASSSRG